MEIFICADVIDTVNAEIEMIFQPFISEWPLISCDTNNGGRGQGIVFLLSDGAVYIIYRHSGPTFNLLRETYSAS